MKQIDALGHPFVLGAVYGLSHFDESAGLVYTKTGTFQGVKEGFARLKLNRSTIRVLKDNSLFSSDTPYGVIFQVVPCLLFPVVDGLIN